MITVNSPKTEVRIIAAGLGFPEGPVALADGSVLVTEIAAGTLARISPNGDIERIAHLGGGPIGAAIGPDGAVYVCNNGGSFSFHRQDGLLVFGLVVPPRYSGGSIDRVDLSTGDVTTLYRACGDRPLRGPNDLVFDETGGFWFTDHGIRTERSSDRTGVFYAQPDGSSITEKIFPLDSPNGIALSPDGRRVETLPLSDPMITNLCFGGPDYRTAFITCSGTGHLIAVDWPRPGGRLAFPSAVTA